LGAALRSFGISIGSFVACILVIGVTGGGLGPSFIPGPPFLWFLLTLGFFGLSGVFFMLAVVRGLQALFHRPPPENP
jgi:hypothetical protein